MKTLSLAGGKRFIYAYYGDAVEFCTQEDASSMLCTLGGPVLWLEQIKAARGHGNDAMDELKRFARTQSIRYIGLQVVPMPNAEDILAQQKVVAFYVRHGFTLRNDLAPWSDFPIMLCDLQRTFGGIL